ncbi:hypothetical protein C1H46_008428 [Malus baccata]|uniref:Uncharacterized protein n=1 Tax=Malus baccata TaxID=106549 RepID=A0A540N4P4_MALBA|nr:hypothetical protein C1H46_008428 [Malus baccata]
MKLGRKGLELYLSWGYLWPESEGKQPASRSVFAGNWGRFPRPSLESTRSSPGKPQLFAGAHWLDDNSWVRHGVGLVRW